MPKSKINKLVVAILVVALVLSVAQIVLGGVVRITGSGDACPDWPTCFNQVVPEFTNNQIALEWSHRANGVLLGIVIVILTAVVWIKRTHLAVAIATSLALVGVVVAGLVGGLVVLSELDPAIRSLHLLLAELTVLFLAFAIVAEIYRPKGKLFKRDKASLVYGSISVFAILATIISGSYLVWQDWGAVCTGWPLCGDGGGFIPSSTAAWTNMAHRIVTLIAFLVAFYGVHLLMRWSLGRAGKILAIVTLSLFVVEVLVGASIPMSLRFFEEAYGAIRAIHLAVATLTWASLSLLFSLTYVNYLKRGSKMGSDDRP